MDAPIVKRALISVSDKAGLAEFARELAAMGVQLYSTGGTASHLRAAGLEVVDVSAYTQFPEMMHGRLKTLHPKIFGGILARRDQADDRAAMESHGIVSFELIVVNLYPFAATISKPGVTMEQAIEQIDIGGPSLVRAAAKNHAFVTIATDPSQYGPIATALRTQHATDLALRQQLAAAAFAHTAAYDRMIADWFAQQLAASDDAFPERLSLTFERQASLRYGENPHQRAAVYRQVPRAGLSVVDAHQRNGKELSYNNLLDLDSALAIVRGFALPATSVIKHNNPCGAAAAQTLSEATRKAMAGDPVSAFGSILAFNREVDAATAEILCEPGLFIEAMIAPRFTEEAVTLLTTRPKWRQNVRLMEVGELPSPVAQWAYRPIQGGLLVQDEDLGDDPEADWKTVTDVAPDAQLWDELRFGWSMVRHVKSNAITVTRDLALWGAGAGQMSRIDSVEISLQKAGDHARGAILASDAFFPFPDSIDRAAAAGIAAIIQPGGSKRDDEVIAACNRHRIPMVFTGRRHFKH